MKVACVALLLALVSVCAAAAATPVRISVAGKLTSPVAKRSWTLRLAVRPASFHGTIRVTATGARKLGARASGGRGSYRAQFVFPSSGRWKLTARAGSTTSRLGTVQVRPVPPQPVTFVEPTAIDVQLDGTLLLVENNPGSLLRVDPRTGSVTPVVPSVARPYAVVRAPSGVVYISSEALLRRVDAGGTLTTVAEASSQIGPVTAAPNGDVYYATSTQIFRLAGGAGQPIRVAGPGVEGGAGDGGPALNAQFSSPHGIVVAADGALLVSDTGNNRIRRIDAATGVIAAFADVGTPDGIDVAADGSVYVVGGQDRRVVHLSASGARIGFVGPALALPYDVEAAGDGAVYVLEAGPVGYVRRIAPDGSITTVSRQ